MLLDPHRSQPLLPRICYRSGTKPSRVDLADPFGLVLMEFVLNPRAGQDF